MTDDDSENDPRVLSANDKNTKNKINIGVYNYRYDVIDQEAKEKTQEGRETYGRNMVLVGSSYEVVTKIVVMYDV